MPAFDHRHYVPSLRCKQGEFQALRELSPTIRASITPLFEVQPLPDDYDANDAQQTANVPLATLPKRISDAAMGTACMIDAGQIDPTARMASGEHPLLWVCNETASKKTNLIPVTSPDRDPDYNAACIAVHGAHGHGVALRLGPEDIGDVQIVRALMQTLGLSPADLDIVVDLGFLAQNSVALSVAFLPRALNDIAAVGAWRSMTVLGGSFPENLTGFAQGITPIEQREWNLWQQVLQRQGLNRKPAFGDYTIQHPIPTELPPFPRTSAGIRYTTAGEWLVFRGRGLHTPGAGGFNQYRTLSRACISDARYHGAGYCAGDNFISDCAAGRGGTGNPTTWRFVGANQHMTFVANAVAAIAP